MNANMELPRHRHAELTWLEKFAALAAWTLGGAIFLTVGWMAMVPDDPLAAVSLANRSGWPVMWWQTTALVVVAAALGTALAGRVLVDAGVFVAALGLSLVSLRGGTAAEFFVGDEATSPAQQRAVALLFAGESIAWFGTILVGILVATLVHRWFYGRLEDGQPAAGRTRSWESGQDFPVVGDWLGGAGPRTPAAAGLRHALFVGAAGWIFFALLSSGHTTRSITHGQSCFTVIAATCLSIYFVQRSVPVATAGWSVVGVLLMTLAGSCWSLMVAGWDSTVPGLPSSAFLRVLPLQSIAVGVASAVVMHWYLDDHQASQGASGENHRPEPASRTVR